METSRSTRAQQRWASRIVAALGVTVLLVVGLIDTAAPASAASGSVTVTAATITRDAASGEAKWDVTATLASYWNSNQSGICTSSAGCQADLYAIFVDNSSSLLDSHTSLYGKSLPDVEHFVGSAAKLKIKSVQVILVGSNGQAASAAKTVSDPYPTPTISLSVAAAGRDPANNKFQWDVTATASNYRLPNGYCPGSSDCTLVLQAKFVDGSTTDLDYSSDAAGHSYPYSHRFTGESSEKKVVSLGASLVGSGGTLQKFVPITDSVPTPTISMSIKNVTAVPNRDSNPPVDDTLSWVIDATVDNYSTADFGCPDSGCQVDLNVRYADRLAGRTLLGAIDVGTLPPGGAHTVFHFNNSRDWGPTRSTGTEWYGLPTQWSVVLDNGNGVQIQGAWVGSPMRSTDESAGDYNPSENGCSCSAADPVNTFTGAFSESVNDLTLPGVGPVLSDTRSYTSSQSSISGSFGNGWSDGLDAHLDISASDVTVHQENGSTVSFSSAGGTTWTPAVGVLGTLKSTGSGTSQTWTFKRRAGTNFTFNSSGYLTKITDLHGNTITIFRDASGNISSASASGGRKLTFNWSNGLVSKVVDSADRAVSYSYDAGNNLTSVTAADGAVTTYAYDAANRITAMTRPGGGVVTMTYDADGRVSTQTDPLQRTTAFSYDTFATTVTAPDGTQTVDTYSGGLPVKRVVDAGGAHPRTTTSTYDAAGDALTVTNARGKTTTYTYDAGGNVLTRTDPLNRVTTMTYNSLNQVLTSKDGLGKTESATYNSVGDQLSSTSRAGVQRSWTYNSNGTTATATDGRGKVTSYGYNAAGLQVTTTDPDNRTTTLGYNAAGFVTSSTNGANETTSYTRDSSGRQLTVTTPGAHTTTNTYGADGNLATVTDARGKVTTNQYDVADELTSTKDPLGHETTYVYDAAGRLETTTDARGHNTTRSYDAFGELTAVEDPNGHTTHYGYDADGNRTSTTLPSGAETTAAYDDDDLLVSTTDAKGKTTSYVRDADGQVTSTTDPLGRVTAQTWTADGQQAVTTQPDNSTIQQTYDANGALSSYTNADGLVTSYSYTDSGLPLTRTEPGSMATSYTYDTAGRLRTTTTPDGHVTTLSYNPDGDVASSHSDVSGSIDVSYSYNADGQRTGMHDVTGDSSYSYDSAGQLTSTTNGAGATVGYAYSPTGQVAKITYPGSKDVAYQYDDAGQMTSLTDWQNRTTSFDWTQDGQLHAQTTPNGLTQTWSYDADGQQADTTVGGTSTLADYATTWNDAGELTSDTSTDQLGTSVQHTYTYDPLSQLASVDGAGPSGAVTATSGGQLTKTADGTTYAYNSAQELTSSNANGSTTTYGYDGNGNRTSASTPAVGATPASSTSYAYDRDGNLVTVTLPVGTTISYTADGDGLRQSRTKGSSSKAFLWDTQSDLPLLLDDGDRTYLYGPSITPIAQVDDSSGVVQYLSTDLLGSTRLVSDAAGAAIGAFRYSAFGIVEAHAGAGSAIGFTGNWTDPDTGLTYLRARDYDSATGQFVQSDPSLAASRQPYAYAQNRPTSVLDPTGNLGVPIYPDPGAGKSAGQIWAETAEWLNQFNPVHYLWEGEVNAYRAAYQGCSVYDSAAQALHGVVAAGVAGAALASGPEGWAGRAAAVGAGSRLAEASSAAFEAADSVSGWVVSAKHLPGSAGKWAKWADGIDINRAVAGALRSPNARFVPSGTENDTFAVLVDAGTIVGTKGQTGIKVVVSNDGRVITAYPVR